MGENERITISLNCIIFFFKYNEMMNNEQKHS